VIGPAATRNVAVLASGGLDSSVLIGRMLTEGHRVWPLFIHCQWYWQTAEIRGLRRFLRALAQPRLEPLVELEMPLADLYSKHWSITGRDVPALESADEQVYLPGHNPLLLVKARVWCSLNGVETLALGTLAGNPFADASEDFLEPFAAAMDRALSSPVQIVRPFASCDKQQVMRLGRDLPLELTFSCMAPAESRHCGACNKCAERQRAFATAGMVDPTVYVAPQSAATS